MKRFVALILMMSFVIGLCTITATAQETTSEYTQYQGGQEGKPEKMMKGREGVEPGTRMNRMEMQKRRIEMMVDKLGVKPETVSEFQDSLTVVSYPDGPGGLLSRSDDLGLSAEQKAKIEGIMKEARQKALAVLSE